MINECYPEKYQSCGTYSGKESMGMAMSTSINRNAGISDKELQTGKFGAVSISGKKRGEKEDGRGYAMPGGQFDPIEQKKALAKKQAYKIVKDALANELKMDSAVQEVKDHADRLREDLEKAQNEIGRIEKEKEAWREECGVDEEYQKRALALEKHKTPYEDTVNKAEAGVMADNAMIRGTRLARLKKDLIRKAQNEVEDALAAASEEVIGMLVDEAKEHMDEKSEELQEKAEERAEEKEQQQEKIDAAKEEKAQTETMVRLDSQRADYQQEIEEMMRKMSLMEEDLKGIKVDETIK